MIKLSYLPKEPTQLDLKISLEWLFPKVAKLSRALTYFWNGQRYNLFCILYAAPYYLYCCALGICRSSLSWFRRPLPNSRSYRVGHSSQYFHFRLVFKCSNFWTFRLWLVLKTIKVMIIATLVCILAQILLYFVLKDGEFCKKILLYLMTFIFFSSIVLGMFLLLPRKVTYSSYWPLGFYPRLTLK